MRVNEWAAEGRARAVWTLILCIACPTVAWGDDVDDMQGSWKCVASLKDGKEVKDYVGARAVIDGGQLTWYFLKSDGTETPREARFTVNESANPKHFDWHYVESPDKLQRRLYVLQGDVLIWSTNLPATERPANFSAGQWQFVMQRVR